MAVTSIYRMKVKRQEPNAETVTDADYADDLTLLANTPAQAKFLLHSLKKTARCIGLYVNSDKTEFTIYIQDDSISALNEKSQKKDDQFTYLCSNISSTERDANVRIDKAKAVICPFIWKSDYSDYIKRGFFQAVTVSIQLYGCTT